MPKTVPSDGPLSSRILWCGEAPGRQEVVEGRPFIGPSGNTVRRTLQWAGIDPDTVRFSNAVRHNPGTFPTGMRGAKLLSMYAEELDTELMSMPNLKVIVACGGPAMTRLTGRRSPEGTAWGIERYHNFVFRNADVPDIMQWAPGYRHLAQLPSDVYIIPVLHPAGIFRTKGRDELISFRRGVQKVAAALNDTLERLKFDEIIAPPPAEVQDYVTSCFQGAGTLTCYIDTEFDRKTKQVNWFGFTFDGKSVYGLPWHVDYLPTITSILSSPKVVKAAHNIQADLAALQASGVEVCTKAGNRTLLHCTLIAHHALHPALGVGLDDAARYYIDDIQPWKDLETSDPHYNALDVAYGWTVMQAQRREASTRPVDPTPEIESRMALLACTSAMEDRGMAVDRACQRSLREQARKRIDVLKEVIADKVRPIWDKRVRAALEKRQDIERQVEAMQARSFTGVICPNHPARNGLRKPPKRCEVCNANYLQVENERKKYKLLQAAKVRRKAEAARWEQGFQPHNNEHLRWLLYDSAGLNLPIQYTGRPRRPTANRAAVDKLTTLAPVRIKRKAFAIVLDIKEVQHLEKAISTFIDVPIDKRAIAHPPYKIQGTRTGRLAGGKDSDEKSDNTFSFNVLNIPREWRRMYRAPDGHVLVAADWRNVEGRLTAMFCKDPTYSRVLADELCGGPKVHSVNASIIYGCDPADAKHFPIELNGQQRTAYDGGKRLTHAWSYGMKPPHMARTFNIPMKDEVRNGQVVKGAISIDHALSQAYPRLVQWRQQLIDDVLGVWETDYRTQNQGKICVKEGRRFLANPFGWQFHFLGIRADQANEVVAFLPQSTGAGMFTRVAPILEERYPIYTGTYDSFVLVVPASPNEVQEARRFLVETMERTWPELENRSFPAEVQVGYNWGEASNDNPRGLREVE